AYHVARLARAVQDELAPYHQQREAWVRELGASRPPTADEARGGVVQEVWTVRPEHVAEFVRRIGEVAEIHVTVQYAPVPLSALDGTALTPADLLALDKLVDGSA
ncbi:MAG TPA: hypothetical protein VFN64_09625, partial [Burkholderiaceae bacterium]|nr:hypothetical protein [Burkholderiaceae bacterium]